MHDIISFLKDAVDKDRMSINSAYIVRKGNIYCRNMIFQAGVAWPEGDDMCIPAEELDRALSRMPSIDKLIINDDDTITIRSKRLSSTIKLRTEEPPTMPDMPNEWVPSPKGMVAAMATAVQFIGERTWSSGVRLSDNRVTAINNAAGITIEVPGLVMPDSILVTKQTVDFLAAQGQPDEYHATAQQILFRYGDGRWVCSQLLNDRMPDTVDTLLTYRPTDLPVVINADFRAAYEDAKALSDGKVFITADGFRARKDEAVSFIELTIKVPADHKSYWATQFLDMVLPNATAWDPTKYPNQCPFTGPGFWGLVIGVNQ